MSLVLPPNSIPTGTDGYVPVYRPAEAFRSWALDQTWMGREGKDRYVPKLGDYVENRETFESYIVVGHDSMWVPILKLRTPPKQGPVYDDSDLLIGLEPGSTNETYRVLLDRSVVPYNLTVDRRLLIRDPTATYAKIFIGSKLDGTAKVISRYYDQSGNVIGENIPLILAEREGENKCVKILDKCACVQAMENDQPVTVVFYSDDGGMISSQRLTVFNTGFVRSLESNLAYVSTIHLESPWLSESDLRTLRFPMNVPLNGLNAYGVVTYTNGKQLRMPVDGGKFELMGFENFVSTIVGQTFPVTLKYNLSPDEIVYNATISNGVFKTEPYRAIVGNADGAYTVKLFGYPVWISAVYGYRMEWWLLNLDRRRYHRVTPFVKFAENSQGFNPTAYGINQSIQVIVNLHEVDGSYKNWTFTQTLNVMLQRRGDDHSGTNWQIGFEPGQTPYYGVDVAAKTWFVNQNLKRVDVSLGLDDRNEWLKKLYWDSKPLYDIGREVKAPEPNMFSVMLDGQEVEARLENWKSEVIVSGDVTNSSTLWVKFFKRTPDTDIILSIVGLPIHQQN